MATETEIDVTAFLNEQAVIEYQPINGFPVPFDLMIPKDGDERIGDD